MATRWRELLDSLSVTWTDSGRNTARGWISIRCPWCRDDPSQHLGINEEFGHYRCLRDESHKGRSPYWLLKGLGVHPRQMDDLLASYGGSKRAAPPESTVKVERPAAEHRWSTFQPASRDAEALDYLSRRQFPDPEKTARDFDLRTGSGRWARRLWFGLRDLDGQVQGWTGRALDSWRQPRYFTEVPEAMLYLPKALTRHHRLALLMEGPFDALRVADAIPRRRNLLVVALCGLSTTGHRRWQLSQLAKRVPAFAIALDSSVSSIHRERLMNELRAIPALGRISRLNMPDGTDDPGEMTDNQVERWLSTI